MLLAADLWTSALIRRAEQAGAFATVVRRGERKFGAVLVKVLNLRTREVYVLREAQIGGDSEEGETVWIRPTDTPEEAALDDWIARQVKYDPDLWIIEIEDTEGRHFLTEKVLPVG